MRPQRAESVVLICATAASPIRAAVYTVNVAGFVLPSDCEQQDPGVDECSYHDAVTDAAASPGPDMIQSDIDPNGVFDEPVRIDAGPKTFS